MKLQIAKIVLYSRKGEIRELDFTLGSLNVLTGGSKTGKSAIIDIIDYCTGRWECNVAEGVIRKYVGWYAVLFQFGDAQIFVARRNPDPGEKTNPDIYLERGASIKVPQASALFKNSTVAALETFLGSLIGISENEHRPVGATREPLEANFRHALLFCFQDQNDIDSKQRLFHRQGEDFIPQAIRDTLPYFLGAIDEERLLKQAQLDRARRHLRQLERQLRDAEALDTSSYPRAQTLLDEAKQVGLLDERFHAANYEALLAALRKVAQDDRVREDTIVGDGESVLAKLRAERQSWRDELERVHAEIRSTRLFSSETMGYEREAKEQRGRLSSIGLIRSHGQGQDNCPVCDSKLAVPLPKVEDIAHSLTELNDQLEAVEAENPRLQNRLAALQRQEQELEEKLRENQHRVSAQVKQNEVARVQQDTFILRARTIGKVIQYVESAVNIEANSSLKKQLETATAQVAALEHELDAETVREKIEAFLNIIGGYMTEFSSDLGLEFAGSKLRLDIRNLTLVADTLDGAIPLYRMGSGENWVGYHVIAHLALHKWFRLKGRPVPAFVLFDQPSQAHYPAEEDADEGSVDALKDEDKVAVLRLFKLMADAARELAPELQIIVMDHADLREDWFQEAVTERWRRGKRLVPEEWMN